MNFRIDTHNQYNQQDNNANMHSNRLLASSTISSLSSKLFALLGSWEGTFGVRFRGTGKG